MISYFLIYLLSLHQPVQLWHHPFNHVAAHLIVAVKVHVVKDVIHRIVLHVAAVTCGNHSDYLQFPDFGRNGCIACRRCQFVGKHIVQEVAIAQKFGELVRFGQVCRQHLFFKLAHQEKTFQTRQLACQRLAHHQEQGVRNDDMLFVGMQGEHPFFRLAVFL